MALLEVTGLNKHFGGVEAVRKCSFNVEQGTLTGLIGPNGAGKTSVIALIAGFMSPDSGVIRFDGTAITGWPAYRVARRGLIRTFQEVRIWPRLSVMDNLLCAAQKESSIGWLRSRDGMIRSILGSRGLRSAEIAARERGRANLEKFGLYGLRNAAAGSLSAGQKRLLEFARILMAGPRLVLLDEPLAGVNPVTVTRLVSAIQELVAGGITVLLVEHNLRIVEEITSEVIVMAAGSVLATGAFADLENNPAVIDAYLGTVVSVA